ncbi:DMT family transporter [Oceanihabitans sp. 2_MG-2023]|uniref:DMT family transporter n=1 Tax=Oceanihabitans sp. 2_MG-2023 TaxID=3062661 RepID=UPI0026E272E0|nr:DMT family transporter [Oceanihabitans sp. 2_MG-2023]MDO6596803.1 DMT family transporter [Oceanihabitans sp. 2_MG-2023]
MKDRKKLTYGILIGVLGIVMFSSKAVMVKLMYQYKIDAISALFLRMLFSFPFYIAIAYFYSSKKTDIPNLQKDYLWLIFFGVVGYYLASYFDFIGLTYIKASLERIILFVYPTIVLLFNKFFLKKPISKKQKLAIFITYIGIIITFGSEVSLHGKNVYLGGLFVFLSALTYASYLVGSGWLIPKFGVIRFTAYAMIVSCICVFIHFGITLNKEILNYPWQVYALGFCVAFFATVIPSFLVSKSIQLINSSNFAVVAAIGPISTIILAVIFLNEKLTYLQILGTVVVILGVLLVSKSKKK